MLGKIEGKRQGWQRMRWLDGITNTMDMGLGRLGNWWWTGRPGVLQFMGSPRVGHDWANELKLGFCDMRASKSHLTVICGVDICLHSQGGINKTGRWREWSPKDIFDPCMSKLTGIQVNPWLSQFLISANSLSSFHHPCIQGSLT